MLFALPLALLAIPAPDLLVALGALIAGFGLTLFNTLFVTVMQERVPDEALARVSSYDWLASVAFMPVGFAIVGPVAEVTGVANLLVFAAALNIVAGALVLAVPSVRHVRRRDVEEADADAAAGPLPAPET